MNFRKFSDTTLARTSAVACGCLVFWRLKGPKSRKSSSFGKSGGGMILIRVTFWLCVVLFALGCVPFVPAQQASPTTSSPLTVGGTGTTNFIPIWTNSTTLGNSTLFQTGGNVVIRSTLQLPATGTATALKGF